MWYDQTFDYAERYEHCFSLLLHQLLLDIGCIAFRILILLVFDWLYNINNYLRTVQGYQNLEQGIVEVIVTLIDQK